jgi:hypothetical protein
MTRLTQPHYIHLEAIGAPTLNVTTHFADQASKVFCAYRDKYCFGASEMEHGCGNIYNSQGKRVGRISYNGQIWDASDRLVD